MTIIKPNQKRNEARANFLVAGLFVLLVASALGGVLFYNKAVNYRHEINSRNSTLDRLETENADMKDNLYRLIDVKNRGELAAARTLVLDLNPQYVKKEQLAGR